MLGNWDGISRFGYGMKCRKEKISDKEKRFMELLINQIQNNECVMTTVMADIIGVPASTVRRCLNKFCKLNVIRSEGEYKSKKYYLNNR